MHSPGKTATAVAINRLLSVKGGHVTKCLIKYKKNVGMGTPGQDL